MGNIYILKEVIHPTIKDTHPILSPRKYQIYPKPFSTFASHPCTHSAPTRVVGNTNPPTPFRTMHANL